MLWPILYMLDWAATQNGADLPPESVGAEMALDNNRPHYRLSPAKVHYTLTNQAAHYKVNEGR